MDEVEFSHWLEGIGRLSGAQIAVARAKLLDWRSRSGSPRAVEAEGERPSRIASGVSSSPGGIRRGRASRIERDALGKIGERKVESFGCAHCGGRDIIGWGRSRGLPRYRGKSCGRTFNAATNTPLSRLRKRGAWLDHAQAMIASHDRKASVWPRRPSVAAFTPPRPIVGAIAS